jgi:hypothetical protein
MKTNISILNRVVRIIIAIGVLVLYSLNMLSGTLAIVLLIVSSVFILTSLVGFCPIYWLLGKRGMKENPS